MPTHPKVASSDHEILDVIRDRWSPRAFDASRDVSPGELSRLFEAARWAPSSANEQPWRFLVADRRRSPGAHAALVAALTKTNQAWAREAPVLALIAITPVMGERGDANRHAWYDAGQAVALLTVQATAIGLSVRQMAGFDAEHARAACSVPAPFEPAVVMAIGYAGDPETLAIEKHREAERRPRARRPIGEFVFDGAWGAPLASGSSKPGSD